MKLTSSLIVLAAILPTPAFAETCFTTALSGNQISEDRLANFCSKPESLSPTSNYGEAGQDDDDNDDDDNDDNESAL